MIGIWNNYPFSYNYGISGMSEMIKQYNSTLKDHQVFQPLPSEMPKEYLDKFYSSTTPYLLDAFWKELTNHYGTPTKKELVSVEKLDEEICALHRVIMPATSKLIAQHIIDTYSLNPPKREWWMDCEKFKVGATIMVSDGYRVDRFNNSFLICDENIYPVVVCTPYIEPSIHDKFMASLSDEQKKLYDEMKEATK